MEMSALALVSVSLCGVAVGFLAAWLLLRGSIEKARNEGQLELGRLDERARRVPGLEDRVTELGGEVAAAREQGARSESDSASRQLEVERLDGEVVTLRQKVDELMDGNRQLTAELSRTAAELFAEREKGPERQQLLTAQFETLASNILEEKSKRFTAQNQTNLDLLLGPLQSKLQDFQKKVEDFYVSEGKERTQLATQVAQMVQLNQQLSKEAHDLTRALKGSGKTQGDWGERVLEQILEACGLRKGHEYELRETYKREDGKRAQPDVVVHLPESKHLVVDAKVSLTAFTEYTAGEDEAVINDAAERHVDSVRRHISELSEKNYQTLYGLKSLDFVIMFVPLEPAFMLAIARDSKLWETAWKRNILLVSPSTFLFVVRTVAYLWREEQQNRNVQEIARRGAQLYDKLVGFVEDLTKVGEKLKQATASYDDALSKLSKGHGNVIRQAEMLKGLGVRPSKPLPREVAQLTLEEEQLLIPELAASSDEYPVDDLPLDASESDADDEIPF